MFIIDPTAWAEETDQPVTHALDAIIAWMMLASIILLIFGFGFLLGRWTV